MAGSTRRKPAEQGLEELNLVEFPLALLCDKRPEGVKTIEFADTIRDSSTGQDVHRRVLITGSDAWGLPTWQDQDVLMALMKLTNDCHGFTRREFKFSLYEVRRELGWPSDGRYKRRLKEALLCLLGMTIAYDHAWRSNGRWKSLNAFHLLDNVALTNTRDDFDPEEEQHLKWNDVVVESVQASNTKGLDWPFYRSLRYPTSKRLYRFLDKRFGLQPNWSFKLEELCKEKLGMSRGAPVWECKRQLAKGIEELESKGFIAPSENRFLRESKGRFRVELRLASRKALSIEPIRRIDEAENPLVSALKKRGVSNAQELVAANAEKVIEQQLENYDDRVRHGETLSAGWLRKAIETEGGYAFRKGYRSKADRDADVQAAAAKKQAQNAAEDLRRREQAHEKEMAAAKRERVDRHLDGLSEDAAEELFNAALEGSTGKLRSDFESAKRFRLEAFLAEARYNLLDDYLLRKGAY